MQRESSPGLAGENGCTADALSLVRALGFAMESLLSGPDWRSNLGEVLGEIGQVLGASRVALIENGASPSELSGGVVRHCWTMDPSLPFPGPRPFPRWAQALSQGGVIQGSVESLPPDESEVLREEGVQAVLSLAVFAGSTWWGAILVEGNRPGGYWSPAEFQMLKGAARALGAAIVQDWAWHQLRDTQARYRAVVEDQSELICRFRHDGEVLFANEAFGRRFGLTSASVRGLPLWSILPPEASRSLCRALGALGRAKVRAWSEHPLALPDGSRVWLRWSIRAIQVSTGEIEYQAVGCDVTEGHVLLEQLEHEAYCDDLTGIANRRLFIDRGRRQLSLARRQGSPCAVLLVDLDRFKRLNDSLGHAAGDAALVQVSERLKNLIRLEDTLARMGGDEFAILLTDADEAAIDRASGRLLEALSAPLTIQERDVYLGASVGIAVFPRDGSGLEDLLRHADTAMYRVKADGGGVCRYDPSHDQPAQERLGIEADLLAAIEEGKLVLHYQPIVRLPGHEISGTEALCRWTHPERGSVPPSVFVELVEGTGLGVSLDLWVVRTAIRQLSSWRRSGWNGWMSVNISARTLTSPDFAETLSDLLTISNIGPGGLVLELTERVLADPDQVLPVFHTLRRMGVRLAVDDFGAGHASFAYLEQLPLDLLKVDQQFVRRPGRDSHPDVLVRTMAGMGHSLGLEILAEGIETPGQFEAVVEAGFDFGQGFLFASPVSAEELESRILPGLARPPSRTPVA